MFLKKNCFHSTVLYASVNPYLSQLKSYIGVGANVSGYSKLSFGNIFQKNPNKLFKKPEETFGLPQ